MATYNSVLATFEFGKKIAELSSQLIDANLVHVLASDAHNTRGRAFNMKEAFKKLEKEFGSEKVIEFKQNAKDLINGDMLQLSTPTEINKRRKKLFGLF